MRPSRGACGLAVLAGVLLSPGLPSRAETLAEIEGLSLTVNWAQRFEGFDPSGRPFTNTLQRTTRLYISTKGNVFVYPAASNPGNYLGPQVFTMGTTTDRGDGDAVTWSMADGHLTRVNKHAQGATYLVYVIDPVRLTCTFAERDRVDPQTGFATRRMPNGTAVQIRSTDTLSSTCTVTRGNVFAAP